MAFEGEGAAGAAGSAADLLGGDAGAGAGAGEAGAGAGTGEGAASGGAGDAGAGADPDWWTGISAEADGDKASHRDWLKSSGIRDLDGLVKVARDNQAAVRDSGRIKVPGADAKPEELAEFHKAIGVPEDGKGYQITPPKDENGADIPLDMDLIGKQADAAAKHGAPKAAFEGLVGDFIKMQMDSQADADAKAMQAGKDKVTAWGADAPAKLAAVDAATRALGLTRDQMIGLRTAWGADVALEVMSKIGGGMAEDVLITGGTGRFGVSAAEAQTELDQMKKTPGMAEKIKVAGSAERIRWDRLNAAVAAGLDRDRANR